MPIIEFLVAPAMSNSLGRIQPTVADLSQPTVPSFSKK
jgi:hypothetical protein